MTSDLDLEVGNVKLGLSETHTTFTKEKNNTHTHHTNSYTNFVATSTTVFY